MSYDRMGKYHQQFVAGFTGDVAGLLASQYDGTNDWCELNEASFTSAPQSKLGIISFWFLMDGGDGVDQRIFKLAASGGGVERVDLKRDSLNLFRLKMEDSGEVHRVVFTSVTEFTADSTWHHFLVAYDTNAATATFDWYFDDSVESPTQNNFSDGAIDWTPGGDTTLGAANNGGSKLNGRLAEVYINADETLDITVEANRRKFISASGKPVLLGATGATPTGSQPMWYSKLGDEVNAGYGENLVVNGALVSVAGPGA